MNHDNQTLIILFLGVALIMSLYFQYNQFTEFILGIFGGIFMQKTWTETEKDQVTEYIKEKHDLNEEWEE